MKNILGKYLDAQFDTICKCIIVIVCMITLSTIFTDVDKEIPKIVSGSFYLLFLWCMLPIIKFKVEIWRWLWNDRKKPTKKGVNT